MTTKAPKFAPVTGEAALAMRQKSGQNQTQFWSRDGDQQQSTQQPRQAPAARPAPQSGFGDFDDSDVPF